MALGPASDGSSESSLRSPTRLKPAFSSARRDAWFTVGVGGPDYDLSELRNWIAWRDSAKS
jgi:hypothetical protein